MDWNWFFSSLSQSAAAIVGIFGAFMISKTLGNQSAFTSKSIQLETTIAECENIVEEAKDLYLEWYIEKMRELALLELSDLIEEDPSIGQLPSEELYRKVDFSRYDDKQQVIALIDESTARYKRNQEAYTEEFDKAERQQKRYEEMRGQSDASPFSSLNQVLGGLGLYQQDWPVAPRLAQFDLLEKRNSVYSLRPELERELERIESVRRKAKHQIKLNTNFSRTIEGNPESSGYITTILLLITTLFFAGVIYPVSFMPVALGQAPSISMHAVIPTLLSFKGVMLIFISAIFCVIPFIFIRLNNSFKYDTSQVESLLSYCKIKEFSDYFHSYELNINDRVAHPAENES